MSAFYYVALLQRAQMVFTCRQDRLCKYDAIFRHVSSTIVAVESVTYCKYVFVALFILNTKHMNHIVICGLSGSTTVFFTLSYKWHDFRKKSY